jgi:hypothetical protein
MTTIRGIAAGDLFDRHQAAIKVVITGSRRRAG